MEPTYDRFFEMLGMSKADFAAAFDADRKGTLRRIEQAKAAWYSALVQRHRAGDSLLPYWVPAAWISRGLTTLNRHYIGEIELNGSTLQLCTRELSPVTCAVSEIRLHWQPLWLSQVQFLC